MPFTLDRRSSGLLLHLTSLPGPWFLGDLGQPARDFVDFLKASGQTWWQMLPVNPVGGGNSPYSTVSSFAGEPLLIDLADLVKRGWLKKSEAGKPQGGSGRTANFDAARAFRGQRLRLAFQRAAPKLEHHEDFARFQQDHHAWLSDYTTFGALSQKFQTTDWTKWPEDLKRREPKVLAQAKSELAAERRYLAFEQYLFQRQWEQLKAYANSRGVGLIGDLPIFVSHESVDCWANPKFFLLDDELKPEYVAGVPPDPFAKDGQLWGNALYEWDALADAGFSWWIHRLGRLTSLFDAVRLDHFIGFYRFWRVDAAAKTARDGEWVLARGDDFFAAVKQALGAPQLIAEDLGEVIQPVRDLRDRYGFPGMKVCQFAFDGSAEAQHHKPHLFPRTSVAYTGTHDNNTTRGWFGDLERRARGKDRKAKVELAKVKAYLETSERTVAWDLLRAAMASAANVTVFPVQDVLGEGIAQRMNVPGTAKGNWRYRIADGQLTKAVGLKLRTATELFDRL